MFREQQSSPADVKQEKMVDALDDGAIVRVSEGYARREGLLILRTWEPPQTLYQRQRPPNGPGPKERGGMDTFRRPLKKDDAGLRATLLDNFHWILGQRRKHMNLTRKQLAQAVGSSTYEIKLLENGVLPANDFVLISALERYCSITLRKDGVVASAPPTATLRSARPLREHPSTLFATSDTPQPQPGTNKDRDFLSSEDLLGGGVDLLDEYDEKL